MTEPTKPQDPEVPGPPPPGPSSGNEAEGAANRWSYDPRVTQNLTFVGRLWGLVLLAAGIWLFAGVTLGYDLPRVPLRDLWPVALIVLGGAVILRGLARRT
jgi:hypothetical protein